MAYLKSGISEGTGRGKKGIGEEDLRERKRNFEAKKCDRGRKRDRAKSRTWRWCKNGRHRYE